jgi:hypothetical protein
VWAHRDLEVTRKVRLDAVRLVVPPTTVVWGPTAAWLLGAAVREEGDLDVDLVEPAGRRLRQRAGVHVARMALGSDSLWDLRGLLVTNPTRTAFDCLRLLDDDTAAIATADSLLNTRGTTLEALGSFFDARPRMRHVRRGRARLGECDAGAESVMETRLRLQPPCSCHSARHA